jgi:hypothetical protein
VDNSCLLFLSNMVGTKHDNKKVPVVTIGLGASWNGRRSTISPGDTTASCVAVPGHHGSDGRRTRGVRRRLKPVGGF